MSDDVIDTTQNLLTVADWVEQHPEEWDQGTWCNPHTFDRFEMAIDIKDGVIEPLCGTTFCTAGKAAMLLPVEERQGTESWAQLGRRALGLLYGTPIFSIGNEDPFAWADMLRRLAKVPENERDHNAQVRCCHEAGIAGYLLEEDDETLDDSDFCP